MNQIEAAIAIRDWLDKKGIRASGTIISPEKDSPSLFPYFSLNDDDGYVSIVKNYVCLVFPFYWLLQYFSWNEERYGQFLYESSLKTIESDHTTDTLLKKISVEIEQLIPGWYGSVDVDSSKIYCRFEAVLNLECH